MVRLAGAGRLAAVAGTMLTSAALFGACSSSPSSSPSTTTTSAGSGSTISAIAKAVQTYETDQGLASSRYKITSIHLSGVDARWAKFEIGPVSSDVATLQSGYGFVHQSGGNWRVTGFGSAQVGCPLTGSTTPQAVTYVTVPPAVLAAFGFDCPPSAPSPESSAPESTTSTTANSTNSAVVAAITAYENAQGLNPSDWKVGSVLVSTVDPTWVKFTILATPASVNDFQPGYGFAHQSGSTWTVTGFGTAEVGCPPGAPDNQIVPSQVLTGFAMSCPSSSP